jgi:hypothetical protein
MEPTISAVCAYTSQEYTDSECRAIVVHSEGQLWVSLASESGYSDYTWRKLRFTSHGAQTKGIMFDLVSSFFGATRQKHSAG